MWSLYRGGLYNKVVFKRWPLNKGFTLGYIYTLLKIKSNHHSENSQCREDLTPHGE